MTLIYGHVRYKGGWDEKNVLLLCLSTVNIEKGKDGVYEYYDNGKPQETPDAKKTKGYVDGYMTNEAPAKSIIRKLDSAGERLDEVIVICSDAVRKKVLSERFRGKKDEEIEYKDEGERAQIELYKDRKEMVLEADKENFDNLTHIELYKSLIHNFSLNDEEIDTSVYEGEGKEIVFHEIEVSDDTEGPEVAEAAVKAARYLEMEDDTEIDLYIDYNGGQRYMASMIVSIANLAKVRGVQVKEILTMNYAQKDTDKDIVPIQNMSGVFRCIDLVAGVNEYINYGRTRMLEAYFEDAPDQTIKEILKDMREFSYALQMCNIDDARRKSVALNNKLKAYKDAAAKKCDGCRKQVDTYEALFSYVVEDISKGYKILFESIWKENLPEIIKWCIERDYMQQALTLYAERMPDYFYSEHKLKKGSRPIYIFAPTEDELKEYRDFRSAYSRVSKVGKRIYDIYDNNYKNYDEEYGWLIHFLDKSHTYEALAKEEEINRGKKIPYTFGSLMSTKLIPRQINFKPENCNLIDEDKINRINDNANKFIGAIDVKRARSDLSENQLKQVLADFFMAKELRNKFNHADTQSLGNIQRDNITIQYGDISRFVNKAMDNLLSFMSMALKRENKTV